MSLQKRLLVTLMLSASLVACGGGGGGNDTLFNPAESDSGTTGDDTDTSTGGSGEAVDAEDSGIRTSDDEDLYTVSTEFIGFYIESPEYDPTSYSVGTVFFRTFDIPGDMEEDYIFEGLTSYHYKDCQDDNLFTYTGRVKDDSSLESDQTYATIDGQIQTYFIDLTWDSESNAYKGPYNLAGSANISNSCIEHVQAVRGKAELYPINTTQFTDTLSDAVIAFDTSDPRTLTWNYTEFSDQASSIEHLSVSVIDYDALQSKNFFYDEYAARANWEALQEDDSADPDAVTAAENAFKQSLANHSKQITSDVFLFQETLEGSATSLVLPDSVNLISGRRYLLNLTAWSSNGESNFVYYHSSHVFFAN